MRIDVAKEVVLMQTMTVNQLREKYLNVFGEGTNARNKQFLVKRIAWRMQANIEGGISEKALRRAKEILNEAEVRVRAPNDFSNQLNDMQKSDSNNNKKDSRIPKPGSFISRQYKGETIVVTVLEDGFEYNGKKYRSLSAIAKDITKNHWNGFKFFQLA